MTTCPPRCILVYRESPVGFDIVCKNCGEVYGSAESEDAKYLAGLNRNSRLVEGRRARRASGTKAAPK